MTQDEAPRLRVEELEKTFEGGPEVLRGVSFEMATSETLAITGPSGSGKSTLLHLIGTLEYPSSGKVRIGGTDPFALSEPELAHFRNQEVGFVFQFHHLLPQYTVLENVLLPTIAGPASPTEMEAWGRELLARVGLEHRLSYRPAELSGGEKQRVAVARALINRPSLLLCDEPTGNLDRATAHSVVELLLELHGESRGVLIVVTHSVEVARRLQRRFELSEGRCEEV